MWNSSVSNTIYTTLNIISGFADIIALVICFIFLCLILRCFIQMKYNQRQASIDVPSILCINTFCIIIMKCLIQLVTVTLPTFKKDFQLITEFNYTFKCRFDAYLLMSMVGTLYWSYTVLTFFRFCRVVYSKFVWFQRPTLYLYILIPAQYILVFISILPALLIFDSFQPIFPEPYCTVLTDPLYPIIYTTMVIFYIPLGVIIVFYICIIRKLRQSVVIRPYAERNRRDHVVIRRILLNMIILGIVSLPYIIIYIIDKIRGHSDLLIYRIQWISSSLASILFAIILPFITTQLRDLLKSNKIMIMNDQK
jgi:hypothetical protein